MTFWTSTKKGGHGLSRCDYSHPRSFRWRIERDLAFPITVKDTSRHTVGWNFRGGNIIMIHQDDVKACYDRIIRSHAIFNSRKFGIPDNICRLYSITHDKMVFKLRINNGIFKGDYRSSNNQKLHGVG